MPRTQLQSLRESLPLPLRTVLLGHYSRNQKVRDSEEVDPALEELMVWQKSYKHNWKVRHWQAASRQDQKLGSSALTWERRRLHRSRAPRGTGAPILPVWVSYRRYRSTLQGARVAWHSTVTCDISPWKLRSPLSLLSRRGLFWFKEQNSYKDTKSSVIPFHTLGVTVPKQGEEVTAEHTEGSKPGSLGSFPTLSGIWL